MSDQQGSPGTGLDVASMSIGILGGTGAEGRGLAHRFALAGNPVIIGSRNAERAAAAAQGLGGELGIRGMANADAAAAADVVIVAVPWDGHDALLASLAALLIVLFGGETHALIPLYAVGVFISFTLSQSGMVRHWWRDRRPRWRPGRSSSTA